MRLQIRAVILGAALAVSGMPAQADFSVRDYCEVTLKASEIDELAWKDRLSLEQSHQGPSKALDVKLQSLDAQYGRFRNQVYAHYGTTFQDYLRYGAGHQAAITLYLEQNVDLKRALSDASSQIRSLRQQMESVMSARHAAEARR